MSDVVSNVIPSRRPIDRAVRIFAILTVISTAILLVLGGFVTSFRAGMADRAWPTEPWYLVINGQVWKEAKAGFLIEHTHRAAGFITGGLASLLAMMVWLAEPRRGLRWAGLVVLFLLLVVYGQFHREMGQAWEARTTGVTLPWPKNSGMMCGVLSLVLIGLGTASVRGGSLGSVVRLLASIGLITVMIQGLLGGFRVFLDQLLGTQLAAVHGTFAQMVFTLLAVVLTLTRIRRPGDALDPQDRARLGLLVLIVPISVFIQLIWGVLLRHTGSSLSQRMHVMVAFVVTGLTVWMIVRARTLPSSKRLLGFYCWHLLSILVAQVLLGVEAWMGKFASAGPQAMIPPTLRAVSVGAAIVRTLHVLVGTSLLADTVLFALRVWRKPIDVGTMDSNQSSANPTVEPVTAS